MRIEFDVTLKESDLYRFNMRHAYAKGQGIISIVMALVCLIAAVKTHGSVELSYTMLYAVFSAVFLVYLPISLYLRSKRQMWSIQKGFTPFRMGNLRICPGGRCIRSRRPGGMYGYTAAG